MELGVVSAINEVGQIGLSLSGEVGCMAIKALRLTASLCAYSTSYIIM